MFLRVSKLLCITFLLFAVSAVNAAPTISSCKRNVAGWAMSLSSDAHTLPVPEVTQITEYSDSRLAAVAAEFLKAPAAFTDWPAAAIHVKSLPGVPGSLFMVLTGFLCVSLVRDRRVWLAALAGLLWLGQAGIQALPQFALRLSHTNHSKQQLDTNLTTTYPYYLENSSRLRGDTEGTRYIGLLDHLAGIPHGESAYINTRLAESITFSQNARKLHGEAVDYPSKNTSAFRSHPAFLSEQYTSALLFDRLAAKAKQFTYFSPAFMFDNLARGPPKLT